MIVWGGRAPDIFTNTGGRYDPASDTWAPTSLVNAPTARAEHSAVWSGDRMIVFGGSLGGAFKTAGIELYDPQYDTWAAGGVAGVPMARSSHSAVWTGDAMIVWGGTSDSAGNLETGGVYSPDTDQDALAGSCDNCPTVANAAQTDADGDGAGDACDCQPNDATSTGPPEVGPITVDRTGSAADLSWPALAIADTYAISRGDLATKGPGQYGDCLAQGLTATGYTDPDIPVESHGYFYLVQARNHICGLGSLGFTSGAQARVNASAGACP